MPIFRDALKLLHPGWTALKSSFRRAYCCSRAVQQENAESPSSGARQLDIEAGCSTTYIMPASSSTLFPMVCGASGETVGGCALHGRTDRPAVRKQTVLHTLEENDLRKMHFGPVASCDGSCSETRVRVECDGSEELNCFDSTSVRGGRVC